MLSLSISSDEKFPLSSCRLLRFGMPIMVAARIMRLRTAITPPIATKTIDIVEIPSHEPRFMLVDDG